MVIFQIAAMKKKYFVYIMANPFRSVLYIGMTNDLRRRVSTHISNAENRITRHFTGRYNVCDLVYFEEYQDVWDAKRREKYLKRKNRRFKERLIKSVNPTFKTLEPVLVHS